MLWLRSCPKCGGDLYGEPRPPFDEIDCLQCGYVIYPGQTRVERQPAVQAALPKAA